MKEILQKTKKHMHTSIEHLTRELAGLRTGRASVHLLDSVRVNYYGAETPLNQLATIGMPDPSLLTIAPFDPSSIEEIEKAIHRSGLGLNPANDGRLIRLPIPPLTEERRAELAKLVSRLGEEAKTAIRNVRREANDAVKAAEKNKEISEDDEHRYFDEVQKLTDDFIKKTDELIGIKKKEVMQV